MWGLGIYDHVPVYVNVVLFCKRTQIIKSICPYSTVQNIVTEKMLSHEYCTSWKSSL